MENLLIHIGYHKTGSTWLQKELFISSNNVFEPLGQKIEGKLSFPIHFVRGQDGYILSPFDDNQEVIKKELVKIILKNKKLLNEKFFVMSHERLSGHPHSSGIDASLIAERLKKTFPSAKVLIAIREQKSFLFSNYFQYLSFGGTHSIKKYLNAKFDRKRPFFSPNHINYLPLIKNYYQLFGQSNVLVLPYEMFANEPLTFIEALGKFVGRKIEINPTRFKVYRNKKDNFFRNYYFRIFNVFLRRNSLNNYSFLSRESTRYFTLHFLKFLDFFLPKTWDESAKVKIRTYIENWVSNRYSEHNKELSKTIGIDLSKYGYY